jgi:lipopolysaccharide export system protein LptA
MIKPRNARFYLLIILLAVFLHTVAQKPKQVDISALHMEQALDIANGAYRFIGNVRFDRSGASMYCDSAYYYSPTDIFEAFSRVHLVQGDTIDLYGDYLHFDGKTRMAKIRRNVRLLGRNMELKTTELDYDLGRSIGYYTNHADIENGDNRLKSREGYYYSRQEMYHFMDSVVLWNPDYTIYSDTLKYHVPTKVAYFFGPTEIIGDSSYIYCEDGWYNTKTNISKLKVNALVKNKTQTIEGDSLYYERETGYGEGFSNIEVSDEKQNIILRGDHAYIHQKEDSALITKNAVFVYITGEADSVYIHADTLRAMPDSGGGRQLKAYYGVRLFKADFQGMCDSLHYSTTDSIIRLFHQPVMWSGENQLSADYIEIWTKNKEVDQLHMKQLAFLINQADTGKFNQIKGKNMVGYFRNNEPYKVVVKGNGQTVYYVKDNDEELMGVNVAQSSDLTIFLKDNKPDDIRFYVKPTGTTYPLKMAVPEEQLILKDFKWVDASRPKNKEDIFR